MKREIFVSAVAAAMALMSTTVLADAKKGSCQCEQYRQFTSFASLADEVATIGTDAIHSDGNSIGHKEDEAQALRLRVSADKTIPDECKEELLGKINKTHGSVQARIIVGGALPQSAPIFNAGMSLYGAYNAAYGNVLNQQYYANCSGGSTTQCRTAAAQAAWDSFGNSVKNNPSSVFGGMSADNVKILQAYQATLSAGSETNLLAMVKSKQDGLNKNQFMTLVQMVGQRLGDDYDESRAAAGISDKSVVTGDQLLAAAKNNSMNSFLSNPQYAGVCRDIGTLQAKMLDARGFPNAVTLSYQLPVQAATSSRWRAIRTARPSSTLSATCCAPM